MRIALITINALLVKFGRRGFSAAPCLGLLLGHHALSIPALLLSTSSGKLIWERGSGRRVRVANRL